MYKLNTFEQLEELKTKLLHLNELTEEQVFNLYKRKGDENVEFQHGVANNLVYSKEIGLGSKMLFRFRDMPDVCYFWNSVDFNNCEILLRSVGLSTMTIGMDFFVWLGNQEMRWHDGKIQKHPIENYFEATETQKKTWLAAYVKIMTGFGAY